jgi:hypothetical protein
LSRVCDRPGSMVGRHEPMAARWWRIDLRSRAESTPSSIEGEPACLADCWCKTTLGRNCRWVVPMRHHLPENNYYA